MSKRKRRKANKTAGLFNIAPNKEDPSILLAALGKKFNLSESPACKQILSEVRLTYNYLEDFISFAKKKDEKICMTCIAKTSHLGLSSQDIEQCLKGYEVGNEHPIYYVDYQFSADYECPHGESFKDVWLMFVAKDEQLIASMLARFQNLKVFL